MRRQDKGLGIEHIVVHQKSKMKVKPEMIVPLKDCSFSS